MSFHVGQKVVCVDDRERHPADRGLMPAIRRGQIYVVRGHTTDSINDTGVLLEGVCGGFWSNGIERSFYPDRFRPLQERSTETGMSILRSLLNTRELVE